MLSYKRFLTHVGPKIFQDFPRCPTTITTTSAHKSSSSKKSGEKKHTKCYPQSGALTLALAQIFANLSRPKLTNAEYSVFLINHAGILENLGSNMGQKSVLNQLFDPSGGLGSVRNGFAMYFSSRLSPSKLRTASKWSQNQSFPLNRSGMIKEKHPVVFFVTGMVSGVTK